MLCFKVYLQLTIGEDAPEFKTVALCLKKVLKLSRKSYFN